MIVIADKPGKLGNRLFTFAHFVAFSVENLVTVSDPAFDEYSNFFSSTHRDNFSRYPPVASSLPSSRLLRRLLFHGARVIAAVCARWPNSRIRVVRLDWGRSLDLSEPGFVRSVRESRVTFVQGWLFHADGLLQKHAATVREFFTPRDDSMRVVEQIVDGARGDSDVLVGVHIRRGDYERFLHGKYFYADHVYARVLKSVVALFPSQKVAFLIASDGEVEMEALAAVSATRAAGGEVEDLYSLSKCDLIIGPPSTFSMWASFVGDVPLYMIEDPSSDPSLKDFLVRRSHMEFPDVRQFLEGEGNVDKWPWAP